MAILSEKESSVVALVRALDGAVPGLVLADAILRLREPLPVALELQKSGLTLLAGFDDIWRLIHLSAWTLKARRWLRRLLHKEY